MCVTDELRGMPCVASLFFGCSFGLVDFIIVGEVFLVAAYYTQRACTSDN